MINYSTSSSKDSPALRGVRLINKLYIKGYSRNGVSSIIELGEIDMGKLICPLCGVYTSFSPLSLVGKGVLRERSTSAMMVYETVALKAVTHHEAEQSDYAILICQACENRFVAKKHQYRDEWSAAYPIQHKPVAEEIPEPVKSEFEEAHLCFAVGANRACIAMCQVALEALWREQKVSGIQELKDKGVISGQLYDRANELRLWGNVAKHELIPDVVEREDAEQLLLYFETLVSTIYVEPKRSDSLKRKREQLKKEQ